MATGASVTVPTVPPPAFFMVPETSPLKST
jgi:hypothetical protein